MNHDKPLFFTGIDWGSGSHQVCVIDQTGSVLGEKAFAHTGKGLCEMADWMLETSGADARRAAAAIETARGPVVESLLERGFDVYSVNPKQLDRFRDRFSPAGAKDDRRDARVLADALRTDSRRFRKLAPEDPDIVTLRELTRTREELAAERVRLVNRMRRLLWEYYPQFNEVIGDALRPWLLELWELVPTPADAGRVRPSVVGKLLKRRGIRRISAEEALEILRSREIDLAEAAVDSRVRHIKTIVERLKLADSQLEETESFMDEAIRTIASRHGARREGEGKPGDVEILRSIPGVGATVLATLLSEAWEPLCRRDYNSLRCLAGIAPVTKQSGKTRYVMRRRAASRRLQDALYHWAGIAVQYDPVSKARYRSLRERGLRHARSLRTVGDRLLCVACVLLNNGELFDKEFKKPLEAAA